MGTPRSVRIGNRIVKSGRATPGGNFPPAPKNLAHSPLETFAKLEIPRAQPNAAISFGNHWLRIATKHAVALRAPSDSPVPCTVSNRGSPTVNHLTGAGCWRHGQHARGGDCGARESRGGTKGGQRDAKTERGDSDPERRAGGARQHAQSRRSEAGSTKTKGR